MQNKMREDWIEVELGEVCFTTSGGTPSRNNIEFYQGSIPWVKSGELDKGIIYDTEEHISEDAVKKSSAKIFPEGSLLIALYGATIGKLAFLGVEATTNQAICGIYKNEFIDSKYLYNFLLNRKQKLISQGTGGAQPNISQTILKKLEIPLAPLPIQRAIVSKIEALFSDLDNGIANLKKAQVQLKIYRQAVLKKAFEGKFTNENVVDGELPNGWTKVKVGEICDCIVPNRDKPKTFTGSIPWLTTPDLKEEDIKIDYLTIKLGLSEEEVINNKAKVIPIGSVIMTCVGKFGISAIVEKQIVINQQLHAFLPSDKMVPKFLAYALKIQKEYMTQISTAITIAYLNKKNCNSVPVNLPPTIQEQTQIVQEIERRLSVCDKMEQSLKESIEKAEALRQSILKKAFEGKLLNEAEIELCKTAADYEPASELLKKIKAEKLAKGQEKKLIIQKKSKQ